jgi:hypothetical protein
MVATVIRSHSAGQPGTEGLVVEGRVGRVQSTQGEGGATQAQTVGQGKQPIAEEGRTEVKGRGQVVAT